jgi:hypothetical protein
MSIMELGALGEFVGAFAVVATLIYLALQIRQNSAMLKQNHEFSRASILQESNVMYSTFRGLVAGDAGLARIYCRALSEETLEDDEAIRFEAYLEMYFAWVETLLHHLPTGLLFVEDKGAMDALAILKPYILKVLRTKVGASWWQSKPNYTPSFIHLIDTLLGESEEVVDTATTA